MVNKPTLVSLLIGSLYFTFNNEYIGSGKRKKTGIPDSIGENNVNRGYEKG
jgi:hypothetical protein